MVLSPVSSRCVKMDAHAGGAINPLYTGTDLFTGFGAGIIDFGCNFAIAYGSE
jgi:hypothetical protein